MPASSQTAAQGIRALFVEDNQALLAGIFAMLDGRGFILDAAPDGPSGLQLAATGDYDVVVLDWMLPRMEGPEVLRRLRLEHGSEVPVIMLTVRASETEKVRALDNGANDYVTKPFGTQELMARVRALLRTRTVSADGVLPRFDDGHLHIDLVRREVHLDDVPVALTRKEYALLSLLLRNAGRVVTQPRILAEIWGPTHQHDTHYLRILVGKLRHKLGDSALDSKYLFTEPGVGLRFKG